MNILLLSVRVGRGHSAELDALAMRYLHRLTAPWRGEAVAFRSEGALLEAVAAERKAAATAVWLLDSRGRQMSSEQVAQQMAAARGNGRRRLIAAIGPPDGWSQAAKATLSAGDLLLSLGAMTLPHELARLVLAEQLYRATTILAGHPYHLGHE